MKSCLYDYIYFNANRIVYIDRKLQLFTNNGQNSLLNSLFFGLIIHGLVILSFHIQFLYYTSPSLLNPFPLLSSHGLMLVRRYRVVNIPFLLIVCSYQQTSLPFDNCIQKGTVYHYFCSEPPHYSFCQSVLFASFSVISTYQKPRVFCLSQSRMCCTFHIRTTEHPTSMAGLRQRYVAVLIVI